MGFAINQVLRQTGVGWVHCVCYPGYGLAVRSGYAATDIDSTLQPYDWYKRLIVEGARFHGLPEDYITAIEAVSCATDPNSTRARCALRIECNLRR